MTLQTLKAYFHKALKEQYPSEEINTLFFWLVEHFLGFTKAQTVLEQNTMIAEEVLIQIKTAVTRLQSFEPIQYITGKTDFYGLPMLVNEHTLIPRPETEELVSWILEKTSGESKILDIGTGSGCVAIALAKELSNERVQALDISSKALKLAKQNALNNGVDIHFFEQDILQEHSLPETYDCIVSNPPYVRLQEQNHMKRNVLDYEPSIALFVPNNDALVFYRTIAQKAQQHLLPNGLLFFEINEYLGKAMVQLLESFGYKDIILRKDLSGKDRMICATHHG